MVRACPVAGLDGDEESTGLEGLGQGRGVDSEVGVIV